jgi:hypothetical protein
MEKVARRCTELDIANVQIAFPVDHGAEHLIARAHGFLVKRLQLLPRIGENTSILVTVDFRIIEPPQIAVVQIVVLKGPQVEPAANVQSILHLSLSPRA